MTHHLLPFRRGILPFVTVGVTVCGALTAISACSLARSSETNEPTAQISSRPTTEQKVSGDIRRVIEELRDEHLPYAPGVDRRHSTPLIHVDKDGRIQLYFHFAAPVTNDEIALLRKLGAEIQLESTDRMTLQLWMPANQILEAASKTSVRSITAPGYAVLQP